MGFDLPIPPVNTISATIPPHIRHRCAAELEKAEGAIPPFRQDLRRRNKVAESTLVKIEYPILPVGEMFFGAHLAPTRASETCSPEFLYALTRARADRKLTPEKSGDARAKLTPEKGASRLVYATCKILHAVFCALINTDLMAVCKPRFPWPRRRRGEKTTLGTIQQLTRDVAKPGTRGAPA